MYFQHDTTLGSFTDLAAKFFNKVLSDKVFAFTSSSKNNGYQGALVWMVYIFR